MSDALIFARGLEKRFGPVRALRGLDLEVPAGATLAAGARVVVDITAADVEHLDEIGRKQTRLGDDQRTGYGRIRQLPGELLERVVSRKLRRFTAFCYVSG